MSASEWLRSGDHFFRRDSIVEIKKDSGRTTLYFTDGHQLQTSGGEPEEWFRHLFGEQWVPPLKLSQNQKPSTQPQQGLDGALDDLRRRAEDEAARAELARREEHYWGKDPTYGSPDRDTTSVPDERLRALLTDFMRRLPDSEKKPVLLATDWNGAGVYLRSSPLSDEVIDEFPKARMWASKAVSFYADRQLDRDYSEVLWDFTVLEGGELVSGGVPGYDIVVRLCAERLTDPRSS